MHMARHRTITCINGGLFSIGPLEAYRKDTLLDMSILYQQNN